MRRTSILMAVILLLSVTTLVFAEDFVVGTVIEHSPDKELIQLRDTIYKVESVYYDDGITPVVVGSRDSISEGTVVQIFPTKKTVDYWLTEKVIVLTGGKKEEMLAKFDSIYDPRAEWLLKHGDD